MTNVYRFFFIFGISCFLFILILCFQNVNDSLWWQQTESLIHTKQTNFILKKCKNNTQSLIPFDERLKYYTDGPVPFSTFVEQEPKLPCYKTILMDTPGCFFVHSKWNTRAGFNYHHDFNKFLKYCKNCKSLFFPFRFGDWSSRNVTYVAEKTRFKNTWSFLYKINQNRHYGLTNVAIYRDVVPFHRKKNMLVWRGTQKTGLNGMRRILVEKLDSLNESSLVNLATTQNPKNELTVAKQMEYKLILIVEGNDVASGLMWALSSTSVVVMPHPTRESWLMHFKLKPFVHYLPVRSTFDDLDDAVKWCLNNNEKCKQIGEEGQCFASNFMGRNESLMLERVGTIIDNHAKSMCNHCTREHKKF